MFSWCVFGLLEAAACCLLNCLVVAPVNLKPRFSQFRSFQMIGQAGQLRRLDVCFFPQTWDNFFRHVAASKLDLRHDLGIRFNVSKQQMQQQIREVATTNSQPAHFFSENILSLRLSPLQKNTKVSTLSPRTFG